MTSFGRVSVAEMRRTLEGSGQEGSWDLSDEEAPVALARCRSCAVEMRFAFPAVDAPAGVDDAGRPCMAASSKAGVVPLLAVLIRNAQCEVCADAEDAASERARSKRAVEVRLAKSGLSEALAGEVSWDSLIVKCSDPNDQQRRARAIEAAREWAEDAGEKPRGLWLHGPAGAGKTRLAATAAVARMSRQAVRWVSVARLLADLDGGWNDDERKAALKVLTDPGVVVLDDLDKAPLGQRAQSQVFAAVDRREQARTTMVVTSNRGPAELEKAGWPDALLSRLSGMCTVLPYPGADRRLALEEQG